jgi:predicted  nucleic acid-binding Zn-ribbon protein
MDSERLAKHKHQEKSARAYLVEPVNGGLVVDTLTTLTTVPKPDAIDEKLRQENILGNAQDSGEDKARHFFDESDLAEIAAETDDALDALFDTPAKDAEVKEIILTTADVSSIQVDSPPVNDGEGMSTIALDDEDIDDIFEVEEIRAEEQLSKAPPNLPAVNAESSIVVGTESVSDADATHLVIEALNIEPDADSTIPLAPSSTDRSSATAEADRRANLELQQILKLAEDELEKRRAQDEEHRVEEDRLRAEIGDVRKAALKQNQEAAELKSRLGQNSEQIEDYRSEMETLQSEQEALRAQTSELKSLREHAETDRDTARAEVTALRARLEELRDRLDRTQAETERNYAQVKDSEDKAKSAERDAQTQLSSLKEQTETDLAQVL